jgi:ferredoxin-NADP reductase
MLELEVTVVERRTEAQDICSLTLAPSAGTELPSHEAGSHIDVQIGDVLVRQYSPQGALCGGHRRRQVPLDHARPSSPLANPASAGL